MKVLLKGEIITKFSDAIITRINELLREKNMNVNQLSTRAGMNSSTIRSILKKRCASPKAETIYYICLGFDITMQEFYDTELFCDIDDNDEQ